MYSGAQDSRICGYMYCTGVNDHGRGLILLGRLWVDYSELLQGIQPTEPPPYCRGGVPCVQLQGTLYPVDGTLFTGTRIIHTIPQHFFAYITAIKTCAHHKCN